MPKVLIQAGHEGGVRNGSGSTDPKKGKSSVGTSGVDIPEREMTPVVADAATAVLEKHGLEVVRVGAFLTQKPYKVDLAVSLHFDGNSTPCNSGASVGYPQGSPPGSNQPTAALWKRIYGAHWPFNWMPDNFTAALSGYYGYPFWETAIAEMLIEFGEITCPKQNDWLKPRLTWLGGLVAHFVGQVVGVTVPHPDEEDPMARFSDVPESHPFHDDIEWLAENNITQGIKKDDPDTPNVNEAEFGPDLPVSRKQLAAFLRRYHSNLGG